MGREQLTLCETRKTIFEPCKYTTSIKIKRMKTQYEKVS